jgi:hypothetical protein
MQEPGADKADRQLSDSEREALIKRLRTRKEGERPYDPNYIPIPPPTRAPKLITPEDESEILNPSDRRKRLRTGWV